MERPNWAPTEVDLERPSVARVWDYFLGGSHNFAADRTFAERIVGLVPTTRLIAQMHRDFLRRAVRHLAETGVRQFLDLGSGIPTVGNVHEVAHSVDPGCRVVYVDHDPIAVAHSRAILESLPSTAVVAADLRFPADILHDAETRRLIDFEQPVAVLLVSVLHFFDDSQRPAELAATYLDALAPGSHLVISHAGVDRPLTPEEAEAVTEYKNSPAPVFPRSSDQVRALFGDLSLVDPGLVPLAQWRPDPALTSNVGFDDCPGFCGVGRKG